MLNFWHVILIVFSIYYETNAIEKLTRQCMAIQGRCAQTKKANCESSFGSGWTVKGSCCRRRPCCVFQCEDIPPDILTNGTVAVTERNIGSTADFTCDARLSLVGRKSIICESSGWKGKIPQCIKIVCPETVAYLGGSKYIFKCSETSWIDAEDNCNADGGHLTSIETAEENTFLLDVIVLMRNMIPGIFWIGLTDNNDEMSYKWLSGEPLNYSNWYQGPPQQPDNVILLANTDEAAHCALKNYLYGLNWSDEECTFETVSVCEIW